MVQGTDNKTCRHTPSSYLDLALSYARGCIDQKESQELFTIADQCGAKQIGNDAIQFTYKMLTGIPNPDRSQLDPRPMVRGLFRTYFPEEEERENACMNFDPVITQRESFCAGSDEPLEMDRRPISFCTKNRGDIPYHVRALAEADWRVLKDKMSVDEAKEFIKTNIHYPDMVSEGMRNIVNAYEDPWELSNAAFDVLDLLIVDERIDPEAKRLYGDMFTSLLKQKMEQLPDPIYQRGFMAFYAETYETYLTAIREPSEIAQGYRNEYFGKGIGYAHGVALTVGGFLAAAPAILKLGVMGLAKAGLIGAVTAPGWLVPALIGAAVGALTYGIVYAVSRSHGSDEFEKQFDKKVDRRLPPPPRLNKVAKKEG